MALEIAAISQSDIETLKTNSAALVENMDERLLYSSLVAVFLSIVGDAGEIDMTGLQENAQLIANQLSDKELKAALVYAAWSSLS